MLFLLEEDKHILVYGKITIDAEFGQLFAFGFALLAGLEEYVATVLAATAGILPKPASNATSRMKFDFTLNNEHYILVNFTPFKISHKYHDTNETSFKAF